MKLAVKGKKGGKQVVFLHGYGAHPELYNDFVEKLTPDHEVFIPEIFGLSGICRRDFAENMAVLADFMREHQLAQSTVIGHSYGALAAMHLASEFPELTRAIAVNPLLPELFNGNKLKLQLANLQRDLRYATGEMRGMLSNPAVGLRYGLNLLTNPLGYIDGAVKAVKSSLPTKKSTVPVDIYYADLDTLFHIEDSDLNDWRAVLPQIKLRPVADYSHNWLIYHGEFAFTQMREVL